MVRALASHQCGPGSIPRLLVIRGLSLCLVLVPTRRGFSPGTSVFPSLFFYFCLVYINDLYNVSKVLELILFADDTNIFCSHTDASYLMEVVNLELKKITCWFYTNKLSINVKKSNFIIFRPRQNRQRIDYSDRLIVLRKLLFLV